jgi:hypothetical protein
MPPHVCLRKIRRLHASPSLPLVTTRSHPVARIACFGLVVGFLTRLVAHEKAPSRGTPSGMCSLIACGEEVHLGSSDRLGSWSDQRLAPSRSSAADGTGSVHLSAGNANTAIKCCQMDDAAMQDRLVGQEA